MLCNKCLQGSRETNGRRFSLNISFVKKGKGKHMGKLVTVSVNTKVSGTPILIDGYWHIEWKMYDGTTHITPYGSKERYIAENSIDIILEDQKQLYVLK